jgi:hypothetical protein
MWERLDSLLERAPHVEALRRHRLELLEARRRRAAGLDLGELAEDVSNAATAELAVPALLSRVRASWDGPLVLVKGPEVALDYPGPRLRRCRDLDLLTDDPRAAQTALLAAGFVEVGEPGLYVDIHHLRPLWWPGLPLVIELHSEPKWPARLSAPWTRELLAAAVPGRLGVPGVDALPPAHHALLLAAHSWAHEPLGSLGHLVDVLATARRTDPGEVDALARSWGCERLWRTTYAAARTAVGGDGRSTAAAVWARHLGALRERTVLEAHVQGWLAPAWALPPRHVPAAVLRAILDEARREGEEPWRAKLSRARTALSNAGTAQSEHDLAVGARGNRSEGSLTA